MKKLAELLCAIACIFITAGCEDDPVYPSPPLPQKYPKHQTGPVFVTIKVPFNPEFDVEFTKQTCYPDDPALQELSLGVVYWWGLDPGQTVYVLNADGKGSNPLMGEFTFRMSIIWATENLHFSGAKITTESNGSFYVFLDNDKLDLTPDYPYDQISFENIFTLERIEGNSGIITGDGMVSFALSKTFSNVMTLKWNGTLDIVISG